MIIEKENKTYTINENLSYWIVKRTIDKIEIECKIPKEMYPTPDELKEYVINNELF